MNELHHFYLENGVFNFRSVAKEFAPNWFKVFYARNLAAKDSLRGILGRFKHEPKLIFDIGANIGGVSRIFMETFPAAKIFAFEPCKSTFNHLKQNLGADSSQVKLFPFGFGSEQGAVILNIVSGHGANSILPINADYQTLNPSIVSSGSEQISIRQLDEFVASEGVTKIDLVKIDVEGFEEHVLKGGKKTFASIVGAVIMELSFCRQGFDSANWLSLLNMMNEFGFDLVTLFDLNHTDSDNFGYRLAQMDAVFVRRGAAVLR